MQYIESGNEKYFSELLNFIEECTKNNIAIISIEFFRIINSKIIPFESLSGFDGSSLYKIENDSINNVHICNDFIKDSYTKCTISLDGLYFNLYLIIIKIGNEYTISVIRGDPKRSPLITCQSILFSRKSILSIILSNSSAGILSSKCTTVFLNCDTSL